MKFKDDVRGRDVNAPKPRDWREPHPTAGKCQRHGKAPTAVPQSQR